MFNIILAHQGFADKETIGSGFGHPFQIVM